MKRIHMCRQGDVIVKTISSIPESARKLEGAVPLAYGEVTGHSHTVEALPGQTLEAEFYEWMDGGIEKTVVEIKGAGARLKHQEHGHIDLKPGIYESKIQREYDPAGDRQVQD